MGTILGSNLVPFPDNFSIHIEYYEKKKLLLYKDFICIINKSKYVLLLKISRPAILLYESYSCPIMKGLVRLCFSFKIL